MLGFIVFLAIEIGLLLIALVQLVKAMRNSQHS